MWFPLSFVVNWDCLEEFSFNGQERMVVCAASLTFLASFLSLQKGHLDGFNGVFAAISLRSGLAQKTQLLESNGHPAADGDSRSHQEKSARLNDTIRLKRRYLERCCSGFAAWKEGSAPHAFRCVWLHALAYRYFPVRRFGEVFSRKPANICSARDSVCHVTESKSGSQHRSFSRMNRRNVRSILFVICRKKWSSGTNTPHPLTVLRDIGCSSTRDCSVALRLF